MYSYGYNTHTILIQYSYNTLNIHFNYTSTTLQVHFNYTSTTLIHLIYRTKQQIECRVLESLS